MPRPLPQLRKTWKKQLADNQWSALFDSMHADLQGKAAEDLLLQ